MNLKRFTARTSREALALVKQAFGDDAVVMSTKPCAEGVEVLAMAPESLQQLERVGQQAERVQAPQAPRAPQPAATGSRLRERLDSRVEPRLDPRAEAVRAALQERHEPSFDAGCSKTWSSCR